MNRSTYIIGFALLAVAATLAATITTRHAPSDRHHESDRSVATVPENIRQQPNGAGAVRALAGNATITHRNGGSNVDSPAFRIAFPEVVLEAMAPGQRDACRTRAAMVGTSARQRLDRLTAELDLSAAQRARIFPALARSTPGYDARMLVGGSALASATATTASEEIHQALNPEQQAELENQEVNRQLWWQDVLARLEADLIDSTGGAATPTIAPAQAAAAAPAAEERTAPGARDDGNLFDLLQGNQ